MVRVLLFAGLAEVSGSAVVSLPLDQEKISVREIRQFLAEKYPSLRELLEKSMTAVNQEYARDEDLVSDADEIAFIPPVSGG